MDSGAVNILIVEDELDVAQSLKEQLESQGYCVYQIARSKNEALELVQKFQPDLILLDINLDGGDSGIDTATFIAKIHDCPIIFTTAYSSERIIKLAGATNPYGYILKPYELKQVITVVETAITRHKYQQNLSHLEAQLSNEQGDFSKHSIEGDSLEDKNASDETHRVNETLLDNAQSAISTEVIQQMREGLVVLDQSHHIQLVNPAFTHAIGFSVDELIGKNFESLLLRDRNEDDDLPNIVLSDVSDAQEAVLVTKNGSQLYALLHISRLSLAQEPAQIIVTITDVSKLVESERKLRRMAFSDSLTGFGNRAYFNKIIEEMIAQNDDDKICILFIDLDDFKGINDRYGHEVGDEVLIEFSRRLHKVLRDRDHLIRLGGDEFVLLVKGKFEDDSLAKLAQKILEQTANPIVVASLALQVSCSIGIAYERASHTDRNQLLRNADTAMYRAKNAGKNKFALFDQTQIGATQFRLFLEQGLISAIQNDDIRLWLQAIVDSSGKVVGAEALCRWYDSEAGFIAPDKFIPIAEESWLIHPLGQKIIREAFLAQKMLISAGITSLIMNVNLSAKQFNDPQFDELVQHLLTEYELEAHQFVFEITESVLLSSSCELMIKKLRAMGFKFALDDFGTGYSSLSRLTDYAIDILKIDKAFVSSLVTDKRRATITQCIVDLSLKLDYQVVAEGVENTQEYDMLKAMGCTHMQGYYFGKPLPFYDFLRTHSSSILATQN